MIVYVLSGGTWLKSRLRHRASWQRVQVLGRDDSPRFFHVNIGTIIHYYQFTSHWLTNHSALCSRSYWPIYTVSEYGSLSGDTAPLDVEATCRYKMLLSTHYSTLCYNSQDNHLNPHTYEVLYDMNLLFREDSFFSALVLLRSLKSHKCFRMVKMRLHMLLDCLPPCWLT